MGLFDGVKKATKFTVVTMPLSLIGWNFNKKMFLWLRSFFNRSVNPLCPVCERGVLLCGQASETSGANNHQNANTQLYSWACVDCGFSMLAVRNVTRVRELVSLHRQHRAREAFTSLQLEERTKFAASHRIGSRIFYIVSALMFINFIRLIMIGAPILFSFNWASFAVMFWIFGMKRAYRAWQVTNGHLFKTGAFWHWFKQGKWLI